MIAQHDRPKQLGKALVAGAAEIGLGVCVSSSRCSASFMTCRIGVLPAPSRKTPTPTSILSGRGSAFTMPISAIRESLLNGRKIGKPPFGASLSVRVSMELRLAN